MPSDKTVNLNSKITHDRIEYTHHVQTYLVEFQSQKHNNWCIQCRYISMRITTFVNRYSSLTRTYIILTIRVFIFYMFALFISWIWNNNVYVMYTMFTNKIRKHTLLPVLCAYTNSLTLALQATPIAAGLRRTIVQSLWTHKWKRTR